MTETLEISSFAVDSAPVVVVVDDWGVWRDLFAIWMVLLSEIACSISVVFCSISKPENPLTSVTETRPKMKKDQKSESLAFRNSRWSDGNNCQKLAKSIFWIRNVLPTGHQSMKMQSYCGCKCDRRSIKSHFREVSCHLRSVLVSILRPVDRAVAQSSFSSFKTRSLRNTTKYYRNTTEILQLVTTPSGLVDQDKSKSLTPLPTKSSSK